MQQVHAELLGKTKNTDLSILQNKKSQISTINLPITCKYTSGHKISSNAAAKIETMASRGAKYSSQNLPLANALYFKISLAF